MPDTMINYLTEEQQRLLFGEKSDDTVAREYRRILAEVNAYRAELAKRGYTISHIYHSKYKGTVRRTAFPTKLLHIDEVEVIKTITTKIEV